MNRVSALTPDVWPELHYRDAMPDDQPGPGRLGQLIKQERLNRRWTQKELAARAGVSEETVKRYESGKTKYPDVEPVRSIFRTLNIDVREIPVALGLVSREEMGLPRTPPRRFSATTERLIDALEDRSVSDDERKAILWLLEARKRGQQAS